MNLSEIDVAILCGGLGKRLRPIIGESPKVVARIKGRPFLDFILDHLVREGFRKVILLTGYKAEVIEDYYRPFDSLARPTLQRDEAGGAPREGYPLTIEFSREKKPLGTGGAVKNARQLIKSDPFIVINGDSFCPLDYKEFLRFHLSKKAWASIALSQLKENRDFGRVVLDRSRRILDFKEKPQNILLRPAKGGASQEYSPEQNNSSEVPTFSVGTKENNLPASMGSHINAGIYCFPQAIFQCMPEAQAFSLEHDLLPQLLRKRMYGFMTDQKFVDIGTPARYQKAQRIFKKG